MALPTVIFSHGKESGPAGSKILAMTDVAHELGLVTRSIDYRGVDNPAERVEMCLSAVKGLDTAPILVGSSMGGYVSTAVACKIQTRAVFVLAPAFGMPGYTELTAPDCPLEIVHGWNDEIVPAKNSIRFAGKAQATLHLIDGDHRLNDNINVICKLLWLFLHVHIQFD